MDNRSLLEKLVLDTHSKLSVITADIAAIKADLAEHIKRTHQNEIKIEYLQKNLHWVQGIVAFLGLLGTLAGIWRLLH